MKPVVITDELLDVLKRLPLTFVVSDLAGGEILWASSHDPKMMGVPSAERVIGTCLLEYIDSDQHHIALRDLQAVIAGESPPPVTYHLKRIGGGVADIQIASMPVVLEGRPGMLSVMTDVSDSERARRDLEIKREYYRQLVDESPDGLVIVGPHGVTFANKTLASAVGAGSPDELLGMPLTELVRPASRDELREARRRVMRYRKPVATGPLLLANPDGHVLETRTMTTYVHSETEPASQTVFRDLVVPES